MPKCRSRRKNGKGSAEGRSYRLLTKALIFAQHPPHLSPATLLSIPNCQEHAEEHRPVVVFLARAVLSIVARSAASALGQRTIFLSLPYHSYHDSERSLASNFV
jgi:hypothetical protein